jgi:cytochrome c6
MSQYLSHPLAIKPNTAMQRCTLAPLLGLALISGILPETAQADGDAAKGKAKYEQLCLSCHGATGAGDGPTGQALPPTMKPRNLAAGEMKFATDEKKFAELLSKGGAGVGLNPLMPAQAGLTPEDIANLYAYVISLKK